MRERPQELSEIRFRLDRLAEARMAFPFTEDENDEYSRLCQKESELIAS